MESTIYLLMKTAFLLGSIGSGLFILSNLYSIILMATMETSNYIDISYYIHSVIGLIAWTLIFICFIIAYQKQNKKSWKD